MSAFTVMSNVEQHFYELTSENIHFIFQHTIVLKKETSNTSKSFRMLCNLITKS